MTEFKTPAHHQVPGFINQNSTWMEFAMKSGRTIKIYDKTSILNAVSILSSGEMTSREDTCICSTDNGSGQIIFLSEVASIKYKLSDN